jgi:hypothetical protein
MIRILIGLSVLSLLSTVALAADFSDTSNHKYKTAISELSQKNIVNGYSDGSFKPDNTINRAEFTKLVINASKGRNITSSDCYLSSTFSDVSKTDWFSPYICYAKQQGVLNGYPDGSFRPRQEITFPEAAKIVSLAFGASVEKTDVWYEGPAKYLSQKNAIPTSIHTLTQKLSRGEMAEVLWRVSENKTNIASKKFQGGRLVLVASTPQPTATPKPSTPKYSEKQKAIVNYCRKQTKVPFLFCVQKAGEL